MLAAAAFALFLAVAVALLGGGLRAGARARTAADLAALAAADALGGPAAAPPCAGAAAVAARNGARLVACEPDAAGVTVVAETSFLSRPIRAAARAEPGPYGARVSDPARVARPPPGYDLR